MIADNRIWFGQDGNGRPAPKRFLSEVRQGVVASAWWPFSEVGHNDESKKELQKLFDGDSPFDTPKPTRLVGRMLQLATSPDSNDIVLDFFAGSATTGQSLFTNNGLDSGNRRFVLVQLPEATERKDYPTIADIAKERLRRAAKRVREDNPMFAGDLGFRVFKLASSNIRAWDPDRDNLATTLQEHAEHLKADRTESDILFELLLKLGLDLTVPIEQKCIAGKTVHSIGVGVLLVCLAEQITTAEVEPLALGIAAWHKELAPAGESQVVFRDSAFTRRRVDFSPPSNRRVDFSPQPNNESEPPKSDDVAKTNLTAILQQNGLENVRSL